MYYILTLKPTQIDVAMEIKGISPADVIHRSRGVLQHLNPTYKHLTVEEIISLVGLKLLEFRIFKCSAPWNGYTWSEDEAPIEMKTETINISDIDQKVVIGHVCSDEILEIWPI